MTACFFGQCPPMPNLPQGHSADLQFLQSRQVAAPAVDAFE